MQAVHEGPGSKGMKKVEKTFKKALDKREAMWYNSKAVRKDSYKRGLGIANLIIDN